VMNMYLELVGAGVAQILHVGAGGRHFAVASRQKSDQVVSRGADQLAAPIVGKIDVGLVEQR
jgi:hypothetical protein